MGKLPVLQMKIILVIYLFFSALQLDAEWKLKGLESDTVISIALDQSNRIIAGTKSNGIKIYADQKWLDISAPKQLPVNDILITGKTRFIAAIGAGSNSDGVYSADTIDGPPYYKLSSMPFYDMLFPQSLAKTSDNDTIYMGGGNSIVMAMFDSASGNYTGFKSIKTVSNPFGIEKPKCAALCVSSKFHQLYAGGYDESGEPGPGHLLWILGNKDSLCINSALNVTAITEGFKEAGIPNLYAATKDSGIYYRSPAMSMPIAKFSQSPNNEPVKDMISLYAVWMTSDYICVAVKSGVYFLTNTSWTKLGAIPAEPVCITAPPQITALKDLMVFAGTIKGVYAFDTAAVSIKKIAENNCVTGPAIRLDMHGSISISFTSQYHRKISVDIFNSAGTIVSRIFHGYINEGTYSIPWNANGADGKLPAGVYLLRVSTAKEQINRRFVFVR
jgi:hypothetical protein